MAKIATEVDEKKLKVVVKQADVTTKAMTKIVITNDAEMASASELLSKANTQLKALTADKETFTKPLEKVIKLIKAKYAPSEKGLKEGIAMIRKEIGAYQTRKDDEAEAKRIQIAGRVGSGKGKLKIETAAQQMAEVAAPDRQVVTESGSISFKDDYEITVVDIYKIPEHFLSVDEAGIKKVFKAGGTVEGVSAKKIKVPINRTA